MINPRKFFTYLKNNFFLRKGSGKWHSFDCPHCDRGRHKQKAAVRLDWLRVKCWECGLSMWGDSFVEEIEGLYPNDVYDFIETYDAADIEFEFETDLCLPKQIVKVTLPTGFQSLFSGGSMAKKAREYLEGRGFDTDRLDDMGFGFCNERNEDYKQDYYGYIIIPFRSKGKLIYYIGRDFIGNKLRYKNPSTELLGIGKADCIFNEDALIFENIIFIFEGAFDALTFGKYGVSLQGWSLSKRQKALLVLSNAKKFVFVPDIGIASDGVTYYKKALQIAADFIDLKEVFVLDLTSVATGKQKDANDIGAAPIVELYKQSKPLTYTDIILKLL